MSNLATVFPSFKDGEENDDTLDIISLKSVKNGWILTIMYTSGDESVEVFNDDLDCLKNVAALLNLSNKVR